MPKRRSGSRSEHEGSGQQLYKATKVCYTGYCNNFDGKNQGRTITAYSRVSESDAQDRVNEALAKHNRSVHRL